MYCIYIRWISRFEFSTDAFKVQTKIVLGAYTFEIYTASKVGAIKECQYTVEVHYKPKPCKAHRKLPVSQLPQGKTCFHYREPLFSKQDPCFYYGHFPVNLCTCVRDCSVVPLKLKKIIGLWCLPAQFS